MKKNIWNLIGPLIGILLFILAVYFLYGELKRYSFYDIKLNIMHIKPHRILLAFGVVVLNYFFLTLYDFLAFKSIKKKINYRKIGFTSFISFAFGNNISFSGLSSSAMRLRFYSFWGVSTINILKIIVFCMLCFWIGLISSAGVLFLIKPIEIKFILFIKPMLKSVIFLSNTTVRYIGIVLTSLIVTYLLFSIFFKKTITYKGWQFNLPAPYITIPQIFISAFEWISLGTIIYILLPHHSMISYTTLISLFLISHLSGLASFVPGGIGVFETVFISFLSAYFSPDKIFSTLLVYRLLYYIIPLVIGIISLGFFELRQKKKYVLQATKIFTNLLPNSMPVILSASTFIAGVILLFSGATPSNTFRVNWLGNFFPLATIELSHFLGSITGVILLILAFGLQRKLDGAYFFSIIFLIAGIIFSLFKGLEYEEAAILFIILLLFIPSKKHFFRKASLFEEFLSPGWIITVSLAIISTLWIGFFVFKYIDYSNKLWWQFELYHDAPRFLRASLGIALTILTFALMRLFRPVYKKKINYAQSRSDIFNAYDIVMKSKSSSANLALLGDKNFFYNDDKSAFIMYGISGKSWISMGDPVGPENKIPELIWNFFELSEKNSCRPVFFDINKKYLRYYLDLGLTFLKLGEEAKINLANFSLNQTDSKILLSSYSKLKNEIYHFEIIDKDNVLEIMPELKFISDEWLLKKKSKEKSFSLGYFNEEYLRNFSIAVVKKEGKIVAFSNLFLTNVKYEFSIDMFRFLPSEINEIMDFLIINIILWGKKLKYKFFNFGLSPLSGLTDHPLAPLINKIGAFIFSHGEQFYNFNGLHSYKSKFNPVWEPKYIALPGSLLIPKVLTDASLLISRGLKGVLLK